MLDLMYSIATWTANWKTWLLNFLVFCPLLHLYLEEYFIQSNLQSSLRTIKEYNKKLHTNKSAA